MYGSHASVSIGCLDGNCAVIPIGEFSAKIVTPPNGDTDYDLPPK